MDQIKNPRVRAPNFTAAEGEHLCSVIEKYKEVIENKKTDGITLQEKQKAWELICTDYNSSTHSYHRTVCGLQQSYKNMKKRVKKQISDSKMRIPIVNNDVLLDNIEEFGTENWQEVADAVGVSQEVCESNFEKLKKEAKKRISDEKKTIMGTGGGPSQQSGDDPIFEKVCRLAGPSLEGMYTIYDGDSDLMAVQGLQPIEATHGVADMNFTNNRVNLKRPVNPKLANPVPRKKARRNETVGDKFKTLAEEKMEVAKMHKELLSIQLKLEQEKLVNVLIERDILNIKKLESEEMLTHSRNLRLAERTNS